MASTVCIENGVIDHMAMNTQFTNAFPFLTHAVTRAKQAGCGGCGGRGARISIDYGMVKRAVADMGDNDKVKLKAMLHADKIRVIYRVSGRMQTVEF